MKPDHYQELKQSEIADDVIELNFRSLEGYEAFAKFVSLCDLKDNRVGMQVCDSQTHHRHSHLYEGYWYAPSWCPLTDTVELKQVKPDYPMLRLVTTKGSGKYQQPVEADHRPEQRHTPRERGYLLGNRQTIISIANALDLAHKLPQDEQGNWHLAAISAMSPRQKYQWCLEHGVFDFLAFEPIKYETPNGGGTPFIYLDLPLRVLEEIANQYQLTLPFGYKTWKIGAKWRWIKDHPQIPLFITEGVKKAAALISHGKIALASFSITTHSEKASEGKSSWHSNLKPELLWLLSKKSGRLIYVVFDAADVKETSRRAVKRETKKIAKKLKKYGTVKIITWSDESCKGIDDFLAKHGLDGLNEIINHAIDFQKIWQKEIANSGRKLTANLQIHQRYLSPQLINQARKKGVKLLGIKSPQNTGKSFSYAQSLKQNDLVKTRKNHNYQIGQSVKIKVGNSVFESQILGDDPTNESPYICEFGEGFTRRKPEQILDESGANLQPEKLVTLGITHRQSLARNLAERFALDCYLDWVIPFQSNGEMVCADSSLMIPESRQFTDAVIDESEQVAWHMLASNTDIRHNRISKISRIAHHGKQVIANNGMITIMDADLTDVGVKFYQMLFGIADEDTWVVENTFKPFEGNRSCSIYPQVESLRHSIISSIKKGERIIIHTSGQKESSTHGTINIEKEIRELFPELEGKIYRIDKESLGDSHHLSYQILSDLKRLQQAQIIIASSSINTGVSLEESIVGPLDQVFGIFYGNYPLTDFEQAIERYRGDCPRHVYLKNASSERINLGSYKYSELLQNITGQTSNINKLLQDDFGCDLAFDLVKFYAKLAARINNDYQHLKDNFICHLEDKGYNICIGDSLDLYERKKRSQTYQNIKDRSEREFQEQTYQMEIPNPQRLDELEKAKTKTKPECIEEYKGKLAKRYKTEEITRELIALDRLGFYPQLQLRFWLMFGQESAIKRDKRVLRKYAENNDNQGYAIDFNRSSQSTQVAVLQHIGLLNCLNSIANRQTQAILMMLLAMQFNPLWFKVIDIKRLRGLISSNDILPYLSWREDQLVKPAFKQVFNIDLDKNQSPMQLFRMILKRIGLGITYVGRYGSRDARLHYYRITDCLSPQLWDEIFAHWVEHELWENSHWQDEEKRAA